MKREAPQQVVDGAEPPSNNADEASPVESFFVLVVLIYVTGVGFGLWFQDSDAFDSVTEPNAAARAGWLVTDFIIISLFAKRHARVLRVLKNAPLLCSFLALVIVSSCWSLHPIDSIRRGAGLLLLSIFAVYVAATFRPTRIAHILGTALSIGMALSLAAAAMLPSRAFMSDGSFRGVYAHKNILGILAALLCILGIVRILSRKRWDGKSALVLILGALNLVLSASATSAIGFILCLSILIVFRKSKTKQSGPSVLRATIAIGIPAVLFLQFTGLASFDSWLMSVFGKSSTLTGRTDIWAALVPEILKRPLLGWGFGGFWHGPLEPSTQVWFAVPVLRPTQAHNLALQVAVELGLIGLLLIGTLLIRTVVKHLKNYRATGDQVAFTMISVLCLLLVQSFTEAGLLNHQTLSWALVTYAITVTKAGAMQEANVIPTNDYGASSQHQLARTGA